MNTMTKLAVAALLGMTLLSSTASADVKKGQKIYLKKLKAPCNIGGATFAQKHTQDEWEEFWDDGEFQDETKKLCPKLNLNKIKKSWWEHIYEFTYEYGAGGSHVPKC